MVGHAQRYPGCLQAVFDSVAVPSILAVPYWNVTVGTAQREFLENPETYLNRLRCAG